MSGNPYIPMTALMEYQGDAEMDRNLVRHNRTQFHAL